MPFGYELMDAQGTVYWIVAWIPIWEGALLRGNILPDLPGGR